ncbi:TolB family protein [Mesohalobacter halotolerans]|uniref:TolB family protein n=1 Tax=Mesohalobacter halotolerans TaxID=1883405 RepID=UPI001FEA3CA9|nr:DPP IV N-terminal domain-containing protein [Mesohalobacter halotolerans]
MKLKILGLAMIIIVFSCKTDKANTKADVEQYTIQQFMDNESVRGGSFSPDNSQLLVTSNRTGIYNVYTIPVDGGEMKPVTQSDTTSMYAVSYFPNDERMLMSADGNGDEINHIFVRELDGTIKDLTPTEGAKASFYGWSKDENYFYFRSNKRDARFFDVYKLSIDDYSSEMIYQNDDGLELSGISDDENYFALTKSINTNDTDLFIYNVQTEEMTKINDNQSKNSSQDFSADNSIFYYTTDDDSEFSYLMSYELETGEKTKSPREILGYCERNFFS